MPRSSVWGRILRVDRGVVQKVRVEEDRVVAEVRPWRSERGRCGVCGRRCRGYDLGAGRRRWRALDLGTTRAYIEAAAPRVACRVHGVVVARVPWARHDAGFTRAFEDQAAWLATQCSKTAVAELMRVSWRTVGRMVRRVAEDSFRGRDQLAGLRRIGIDEIAYRRGQHFITLVVDHDSGRLAWVREGREKAVTESFFDDLGPRRTAELEFVTTDAAPWIVPVVRRRAPQATICLDPFHVVQWTTTALDEVRREVWNQARRDGLGTASSLKGSRWALCKNPENLTAAQRVTLDSLAHTNEPLYRAYLLKEQMRLILRAPFDVAAPMLQSWITWARDSGLRPFVRLAAKISHHRRRLEAALCHRLSNARVEALNTRIRLITRRAFGFHSAPALMALAMLSFGGQPPRLPGRAAHT